MSEAQSIRLGTGDKIAIAIGLLAAAGGIAAVAFEHAFPEASVHAWRVIFFLCVTVVICCIFYLIYDLSIRPRWPYQKIRRTARQPVVSTGLDIAVVERKDQPGVWTVEAIDNAGDGDVYQALFIGRGARDRAMEYAQFKYGHGQ